jgi:hypothetical protein
MKKLRKKPVSDSYDPRLIKNKVARHILIGLAIGVAVPIYLSSPYGLYFLVRGAIKYSFCKSDFHREIKRLHKQGYVALIKTPEGFIVTLKKKAQRRLKKIELEDLQLVPAKKWDGKWRLFIFDIPEQNKQARDELSRKLKELGMCHIQRSVFAYPYDCREELNLASDYYEVSRFTTYAEVNKIDLDKELRRYFKLYACE